MRVFCLQNFSCNNVHGIKNQYLPETSILSEHWLKTLFDKGLVRFDEALSDSEEKTKRGRKKKVVA